MVMPSDEIMLWTDLETSDLDPYRPWSRILETSFVSTDKLGEVIKTYTQVAAYPKAFLEKMVRKMPKVVLDMHTKSGLMDDLFMISEVLDFREDQMAEADRMYWCDVSGGLIEVAGTVRHNLPMSGASVHFDRRWFKHFAPLVEEGFHYRDFDISTIRMCVQNCRPDLADFEPSRRGEHRTLADVTDAINYYKWAQAHFFVKQGGTSAGTH